MNEAALSVIEEFVRSPDPAQRRNAVTALVALASEETIGRVVGLATSDDDRKVSECAERELAQLSKSGNQDELLSNVLGGALGRDDDPSVKAYQLIGRIQSAGGKIQVRSPSWWRPVKMVWSMMTSYAALRKNSLRWRVFRGGFLAAALFFLLLYIATVQTGIQLESSDGWAWCVVSILIAAVWGTLATVLSTPLGNQYYWRTALALELIFTAIPGAVAAVIILTLTKGDASNDQRVLIWLTMLGFGPVIRLGSVAGGSLLGRDAPHSWWGENLAGICAGAILLTLCCLRLPEFGSSVWVFLLPATAAIAYGHTTFDQLEQPAPIRIGHGLLGGVGRAAALGCTAVCVMAVVLVIVGHHRKPTVESPKIDPLRTAAAIERTYPIDSGGYSTVDLEVEQDMTLTANLSNPDNPPAVRHSSLLLKCDGLGVDFQRERDLKSGSHCQLMVVPGKANIESVLGHFRNLVTERFNGPSLIVRLSPKPQPVKAARASD